MNSGVFETQYLRVRIENNVAWIDQRRLSGERWQEIDHDPVPVPEQWLSNPIRTSPLKVALRAFETENPGNLALRQALGA